jgi:NAD(P) transhydrogenase subunit alpha
MRIGIPAETRPGETRVAATPETVKKLAAKHQVIVESGAGLKASIIDDAYVAAGAVIGTAADAFGAEVVLKVRAPDAAERAQMKAGAVLIGMLNPFDAENIAAMAAPGCRRSRSKRCRALPARSRWTCCPRRPTSPATRR